MSIKKPNRNTWMKNINDAFSIPTKPLSKTSIEVFQIIEELADEDSNSVKIKIGEIAKGANLKNKSITDSINELVKARYLHKMGPSLFIILKGLPE
jgi:DNA-binding MarR family transcriptional regulator